MKFTDIKLPEYDYELHPHENCTAAAMAAFEQVKAHYEAKMAEEKLDPEKLFEHPNMPGKKFRMLKVGEVRERTDFACSMNPNSIWVPCATYGYVVGEDEACHYYREVPQPAPEWRLPDPPEGQQWHRDDWTQDMLPEGYRPLLKSELDDKKHPDIAWRPESGGSWRLEDANDGWYAEDSGWLRTRRPLPAPVEYVQLWPEDVPPGSAVRRKGFVNSWSIVTGVDEFKLYTQEATEKWRDLRDGWEILRPNSTTWEPCKKPKV